MMGADTCPSVLSRDLDLDLFGPARRSRGSQERDLMRSLIAEVAGNGSTRPWVTYSLRASRGLARLAAVTVMLFLVLGAFASTAMAQPSFVQSFSPSTIGPGSVSTLQLTIANGTGAPVTDLAFTDNLPAGVTIATPSGAVSTCLGTLTAADGGSTITLTDGAVAALGSCTIEVSVIGASAGTFTNTTGDLTSSAGNSGTSSANLTVANDRPGFSKAFSSTAVRFGGRSTLTFTIDNSANSNFVFNLNFTDSMPSGMEVASPTNAATTCQNGVVTAASGSNTISFTAFSGLLAANSSCTVSVDVLGNAVGVLENLSGELSSSSGSSGKATAALTVSVERIALTKSFTNDPVRAGDSVDLELTILNLERRFGATDLTFTDDLDAVLSGLIATGTPIIDPCGPGSTLTGTSLLTLTGGNLPAEGSCTFSVTLDVPVGAAPGQYLNETSAISGNVGGRPTTGLTATDTLFVTAAPTLTKTFLTETVGAGDTVTMEFTVSNPSGTANVTDIAFSDNLDTFLSGLAVTSLPAAGFCGSGSTITAFEVSGELTLQVSGGSLGGGESCTFAVDLSIPEGTPPGSYLNSTSDLASTVDGQATTGNSASDTLNVVGSPLLRKLFTDDPVAPGDTVTLEFNLSLGEEAPLGSSAIAFTDDLTSVLAGLTAIGLPASDVCGAGSEISGTTNLSFSGGSLAPGESCTFSVTLQVPASALPGTYSNTTSSVVSESDGTTVIGIPAQDDLQVSGLTFSMDFVDDPVIAGGDATLEYTIENTSVGLAAAGMLFTHNLNLISGVSVSAPATADVCGTGSSLTVSGTFVIFQQGNLAAGESCTFSVIVTVPTSAASGDYLTNTSNLSGTVGGSSVVLDPASAILEVASEVLGLSKEFTDDPVSPGEDVTLSFTVENLGEDPVTDITFTDDLDAVATGLASTSGTQTDICGVGSEISGTGLLTFTGGSLAAGASCTFAVTVSVPTDVDLDSTLINVTSAVTGSVGGLAVSGNAATAELEVDKLTFAKSFSGSVEAGSGVTLTFTIRNESTTSVARGLAFFDDLGAMLPGTIAGGLPSLGDCGEESVLDGTTFLTMQSIDLLPGGSCTFSVDLLIPATALAGDYVNTTSNLFLDGIRQSAPAVATLTVLGLDSDDDGIPDVDDNCPETANPLQEDADLDGIGDACDSCPLDADNDGDADGVCGDVDNCPETNNPDQSDIDGDGIGDVCDAPANACLGTIDDRGCCVDEFGGTELSEVWGVADIGDAVGATATVSGGVLDLSGTGSELYHGDDNGAFVHQTVAGDFRMELDIVGLPVDTGGEYRKGGLMARAGLAPNAARVSVHYLPAFPARGGSIGGVTALMFDARDENGVAFELASTVPNVALPVRVAIQRRGDVWSVYYSTDAGASWIHPMGGAGGETTIAAGPAVLAGPTVTSYDPSQALTMSFDNVALCRPEGEAVTPTTFECNSGADLDVVVVLDRSGSMGRDHGGSGISKHDAARNALVTMLEGLALRSGSARAALVTVNGGSDAAINLASGATLEAGFSSPAAIADLLATFSMPVTDPVDPLVTSPLAITLDEVLGLLQADGNPADGAVVVLGSDMTPNIDGMGEGPLAYQETEISAIGLTDGFGDFLPAGLVAWLGSFNPSIGVFDGQVVADTMVAIETLRDDQGDARIFSLIPRGTAANPPVLSEGLAEYAAWYTQGAVVGADDPAALDAAVAGLLTAVDCDVEGPAQLSGRVFDDLDGDGVDDAGEPGIAGVDVTAGGSSAVTDSDGNYSLTVAAGATTIVVDSGDLGAVNVPTVDPDGLATPNTAALTVGPWQVVNGLSFGYSADDGGPIEGCLVDDFEDGVLDADWSTAFIGDADQGSVVESGGTLNVTGDGTTAYAGGDNGVFVYREIEGDFRAELDVLGFPTNQGGAFRKAGLMMRAGLGSLGARVMVQVIPDFGGTPVLQFRARTVAGGPGDVAIASNVRNVSAPVRLAIEKSGDVYSVQYSTDGGNTWVTPAGGFQGSVTANLGSAPLVGTNVVSYDANVTLEAEVDNFQACAPGATP